MKQKYLGVMVIALACAGVLIFAALYLQQDGNRQSASTILKGALPKSEVFLDITHYERDEHPDDPKKPYALKTISKVIMANENGEVSLPPLQQYHDYYAVRFKDLKKNWVDLNLDIDHQAATLKLSGSGFEEFSNMSIESNENRKELRTDWSGMFEQLAMIQTKDFEDGNYVRLAFLGSGPFSDIADQNYNPHQTEVVIAMGGGPTSLLVAQYVLPYLSPTCLLQNGTTTFAISVCDVSRMNDHLQPTSSQSTISGNYVAAMMLMAEQFSAVMMQQMNIIGTFIDAKEQQETKRDFRLLVVEAHKDYHPSELMCEFGTYVRSVSHAEEKAATNKKALNEILTTHYRQPYDNSSESASRDLDARLAQFTSVYCDPNDQNAGLWLMCTGTHYDSDSVPSPSGSDAQRNRYNKDIDYYQTIERDLTLNIDFDNGAATDTEEDVVALAKNLYWPRVYDIGNGQQYGSSASENGIEYAYIDFFATRHIMAQYNVAHNSFVNIVGMKSASNSPAAIDEGPAYMKALLREFNMSDTDIEAYLGASPSYYAQMEVLTKKIYQNPNFYTNLYDKPANVDRINATMEAIQLMQQRDRHESMLRTEMLTSMLVEQGLRKHQDKLNKVISESFSKRYE